MPSKTNASKARPEESMGLDRVAIGESAIVSEILGDDALTFRLMEMGFVPGVRVRVAKAAPLLDPLEFELRGYHVSLRRAQASRIIVTRPWPGEVLA